VSNLVLFLNQSEKSDTSTLNVCFNWSMLRSGNTTKFVLVDTNGHV